VIGEIFMTRIASLLVERGAGLIGYVPLGLEIHEKIRGS
jgi:hypothetical protein